MKNVKEIVRKAMLNNGTKDDMYKAIVEDLGCSRHAAKVLLHSFIWECSEAYMVHAAFSESHFQADKNLLARYDLRENKVTLPLVIGNIYDVMCFESKTVIGSGVVTEVYSDDAYLIRFKDCVKEKSHLENTQWLVSKDNLISPNSNNAFGIPAYEVLR
ncbi:hypothetical protein CPT_Michonne109 [Citrobacter phage Michonne]|uniref:Uncharacterized protein n=1 Tax=Citrobacter phage Michonne TaxID=1675603 RepID=A0A0K1LPD4_9CAUD|nr:hypothetical protein CPT_Michonne_gp120 [Citrobacter phage Michonne]AKU44058.1 hypothetical protein CPT_Michonne109 [Citrobacter phage Michonne]AYR00850.1 hypothetical protein CPT_Maleficent_131 [Citrobacter phage Maleficent]